MADEFKAEPKNIEFLLRQVGAGFYVPDYQRRFTWGKEDLDRLFEDICYGLDQRVLENTSLTFLGTLILVDDKDGIEKKNSLPSVVYHVIDGQQRMTTLLMAIGILRNHIRQCEGLIKEVHRQRPTNLNEFDNWLLDTMSAVKETLFDCMAVPMFGPTDVYKYRPRLIRQEEDVYGKSEATAEYKSDIAWYLWNEIVTIKVHNDDDARRQPIPDSKSSLRATVKIIEDSIQDVEDGKSHSEVLNNLSSLENVQKIEGVLEALPNLNIPDRDLEPAEIRAVRLLAFVKFIFTDIQIISVLAPSISYARRRGL
jgi:Protein of unknown function DUF262